MARPHREIVSDGTKSRDRRPLAALVAVLAVLAILAWRGREPAMVLPGGPARVETPGSPQGKPRPAGAARGHEAPAEERWPEIKAGVNLLELNRHAEADDFFRERLEKGGLTGEQAGMALYFRAEALFAMDKLKDAAELYRKFLTQHAELPAADNARSALEYIGNADAHRQALARRRRG